MGIRKIVRILVIAMGICFCAYPLLSGTIQQGKQSKLITTYQMDVQQQKDRKIEETIQIAKKYNEKLFDKSSGVTNFEDGTLYFEPYEELLNLSNTGVMAILEIPQIDVNLPIYHGTSEEVLAVGVGHLEGTSLPVGGKNTHCVLTGHRGLPSAKLFTRLDEMKKGDLFFLRAGKEILAYSVKRIRVINPKDVDGLSIEPEEDKVTLITCTPYGINSHRLVVTGKRVDYEEKEHGSIKPRMASARESFFVLLPFVMVFVVMVKMVWKITSKRRENRRGKKK